MPRLTSSVLARTLTFSLLTAAAQAQLSISDPGQDVFNFSAPTGELSGLSWLTADSYQAVSDAVNERRSVTLRISLNPAYGRISAASQTAASTLATVAAGAALNVTCVPPARCFASPSLARSTALS